MKLSQFAREVYENVLLLVELPVAAVQMTYQGMKSIKYSNEEIKRIANNINPNKVKIIEKLEQLNKEEEFTALVDYTPLRDLGPTDAPEQIQIAYQDKRYILIGNNFNFENAQTHDLQKEGYEIEFNHAYDAKQFLDNAKPIKLTELANFIETKMKLEENESQQKFEQRVNQMYDSIDAKFNLSIFKEKMLLEDIVSDVEALQPIKKVKNHKI